MGFFLAYCAAATVAWILAMLRGSAEARNEGDLAAASYYERPRARELRQWNRRHRAIRGEFIC